jgi:hypothetical protein
MSSARDPMPRPARSPIPVVIVGLALALASAVALAEPSYGPAGYVAAPQTEHAIPGVLSPRGLDAQAPERSRDGGHAGFRGSDGLGPDGDGWRWDPARPAHRRAPQDAARQALARAGRLSAPATAPPHLS